jgi:hypothetical protein
LERAASILLEQGADSERGDNRGRQALALAKERGHEGVCKILEQAMASARSRQKEGAFAKFLRWWKAEEK